MYCMLINIMQDFGVLSTVNNLPWYIPIDKEVECKNTTRIKRYEKKLENNNKFWWKILGTRTD